MIFKPSWHFETGCASYLLGCGGLGKCVVVSGLVVAVRMSETRRQTSDGP